jgi:hypothetical protein
MRRPLFWLLLFAPLAFAQNALPDKETLVYNIEWRLITAGRATIHWNPSSGEGTPGGEIKLQVESVGLVSKLYKVDVDYRSVVGRALCAESAVMTGREGNRHRETSVTIDSAARKARYQERDLNRNTLLTSQETDVPECVHDVVSGFYYLRTMNLEPGQSAEIPVTDGKKSVMVKVEAQQREDLKLPDGVHKTIRYEVHLFNNVLYRRPARLFVWLTDDRRKLPVQIRVRMQITIGTINLQLAQHE